MAGWIGAISASQANNWAICKERSLFGTTSASGGGAKAGDELFIWLSGEGWLARCRLAEDARPPQPGEAPWPEPHRYRYIMPITIEAEMAVPHAMSGSELAEHLGIPTVRLSQFPKITNEMPRQRLRALINPTSKLETKVLELLQDDAQRQIALRAIAVRQGQPAFRAGLMSAYGAACAMTGCSVPEVLEAAHIDPYRGPQTNRVSNGLLLRADVHTLFDLLLVTVLPVGVIRVAPALEHTEYADLDERLLRKPINPEERPKPDALSRHNSLCTWIT